MENVSQAKAAALADTRILKTAIVDSFRKLHPRTMIKNPVMFVVEVGALLTSIQLVRDSLHHAGQFGFGLQITLWLWFTVLFANFAEAMAEGCGGNSAQGTSGNGSAPHAPRWLYGDCEQLEIALWRCRFGFCRRIHARRRRGRRGSCFRG